MASAALASHRPASTKLLAKAIVICESSVYFPKPRSDDWKSNTPLGYWQTICSQCWPQGCHHKGSPGGYPPPWKGRSQALAAVAKALLKSLWWWWCAVVMLPSLCLLLLMLLLLPLLVVLYSLSCAFSAVLHNYCVIVYYIGSFRHRLCQ